MHFPIATFWCRRWRLHGGLSGFVLPASWDHSGEQLVDPVEMPSYHGEMELALCEDLPRSMA